MKSSQGPENLSPICNIMTPNFKQLRLQRIYSNFYEDKRQHSEVQPVPIPSKNILNKFKNMLCDTAVDAKKLFEKIVDSLDKISILKILQRTSFKKYHDFQDNKKDANLKNSEVYLEQKSVLPSIKQIRGSKPSFENLISFYKDVFQKNMTQKETSGENYKLYLASLPKIRQLKLKYNPVNFQKSVKVAMLKDNSTSVLSK